MIYTQKYCLVSFLGENPQNGAMFSMEDWPLHVTLADVFAIDLAASYLAKSLAALSANQHTVHVRVLEPATLGSTSVMLLEKSPEILRLHTDIIDILQADGAVFNTPEFTGNGFLPHCTVQREAQVYTGDTIALRNLTLIDMFPDGNWQQRMALNTFKLGS